MRHWVFLVVSLGLGLVPAMRVRAESLTDKFQLSWQAPGDCPSREAVVASVSRLVSTGHNVPDVLEAQVRVKQQSASHYTLWLTTEHNGILGERVFHGRSCQAVVDAAVVTLALMLSPDSQGFPEATPETVARVAPSAPAQAPNRVVSVSAKPKKKVAATWFATSSLGLHVGILPEPGPELSLGTGLAWGRGSVWLRGGYAPAENVRIAGQPNRGARLWASSATALGCWALVDGAARLGTCLGADVTRVQGYGLGVSHSRTGVTAWTSPALGIFADLALKSHVALRLTAIGNAPITRPDTHLDDIGSVQRPAPFGARLHAGMVWHWP